MHTNAGIGRRNKAAILRRWNGLPDVASRFTPPRCAGSRKIASPGATNVNRRSRALQGKGNSERRRPSARIQGRRGKICSKGVGRDYRAGVGLLLVGVVIIADQTI